VIILGLIFLLTIFIHNVADARPHYKTRSIDFDFDFAPLPHLYAISVVAPALCLATSFRFNLAMDTLAV
jgi:hypothetical protein